MVLPKQRHGVDVCVENQRREEHCSNLGENGRKQTLYFKAVYFYLSNYLLFTFDRKAQTLKCSRESPRFNLTVESSNKKPSKALQRQKPFTVHIRSN